MNPTVLELVRYRLAEARETLSDAETLLEKNSTRSAMNRIYYAMFYAAIALLATRSLASSKHSGAIALFRREFVKPGLFPADLAKCLGQAFDLRNRGDYREFVVLEKANLQVLLEEAKAFVAKAEEMVAEAG